jgi:hypothetical protein
MASDKVIGTANGAEFDETVGNFLFQLEGRRTSKHGNTLFLVRPMISERSSRSR